MQLHYGSDRVPGRGTARFRKLRVSGATVPASLRSIEFTVEVAGRRVFQSTYAPAPNLLARISWDGKDAYGRLHYQRRNALEV